MSLDFKSIADQLGPSITSIVMDHCSGGEIKGNEYVAATILGGKGTSFRINLTTGKWADFSNADERGHDVISYYAKVKGINNGQAAKELQEKYLGNVSPPKHSYPVVKKEKAALIKPPVNAAPPQQIHLGLTPAYTWCYRDGQGDPLFYILRYNLQDGSKEFRPLCYESTGRWVSRGWPSPRPLYNLDLIIKNPDKPVLICEGEKSADAAAKITSAYITTTWPNGAPSVTKADFSALHNRKVLLWPDADEVGINCMAIAASILQDICKEVKLIDTDKANGWDAADALSEDMDHQKFIAWAKPLVKVSEVRRVEVMGPEQEISDDNDGEETKVSKNWSVVFLDIGVQMTHKGTRVVQNMSNVAKILAFLPEFKDKIWFDTFHHKFMTTAWSGETRIWQEEESLNLQYSLQSNYQMRTISTEACSSGMAVIGYRKKKSEVFDWLSSITWDGESRIEQFFIKAMGAPDNEYTRAVGRNFFISMAARIVKPGSKVDTMVILEGAQGTFKSTSLNILGGDYYGQAQTSMESKDFKQGLLGKILVEFGELDQFRKTESTKIKDELSTKDDEFRLPYTKDVVKRGRTCVFVGTTNRDKYLQDETGARRFWPIKVTVCDTNYIKEFRDQFFAEAYALYQQGSSWHQVPEQAKDEQEARREADPYEDYILEWVNGGLDPSKPWLGAQGKDRFTIKDVWEGALRGDPSRLDKRASNSIGKSLRALGYESVIGKDKDRVSHKFWTKTPVLPELDN